MYLNNVGLNFVATSQHSVDQFDQAVSAYLAAATNPMDLLDSLLDTDPEMIMAHCLRGYMLKLAAHPGFSEALKICVTTVTSLAKLNNCSRRESLHAKALSCWVAGREDLSLPILESLLLDYPLDMLALRLAHYMHFYNGIGALTRDSIQRVLPAWDKATPNYGFLMGMYAFGLEESTDYKSAEKYGRLAIDINRSDIWAAHAVAHVLEMQNRHEEGLAWIDKLRGNWDKLNNFRNHVIWHEALYHIGLGAPEAALHIYDTKLTTCLGDDFYLDMCNASALLARLDFLGVELGERWKTLAQSAAPHAMDQELLFASLHYLIPLAQAKNKAAKKLIKTLDNWSCSDTRQGELCTSPGLQLAQSVMNAQDQPAETTLQLKEISSEIYKIGGSTAQRDLFRLLYANSSQRAGTSNLKQNWPSPYTSAAITN